MNRFLSSGASMILLAIVMFSGTLPSNALRSPAGSAALEPQAAMEPAYLPAPSTTDAAPDRLLIELRPPSLQGTSAFGQSHEANLIVQSFAALGMRSAEPVFAPVNGILSAPPTTPDAANLRRFYRIQLAPGTDREQAIQALRSSPLIAFAEPDYQARIITTPNDPRYPEQWALATINAESAWDVTTGGSNATIAVIDSGVDTTHTDLASQLWVNPGEIPSNGLDDDNNGHIDDVNGWNFLGNNADLSDTTGHGTQVAGVLAAAANNSTGGAGMCWGCRLMIVKVAQSGGVANYSDIAAGVLYAAQKGAKVINLSLGGASDSATLRSAIAAAAQSAVIVGGAGNNGSAAPFYPAAYDEAVLAVAGTTQTDTKVITSDYGAWVDISAPGENILTTFSGGGYGAASGTSVAAPFAAGLAGLLLSQHPDWSPAQVRAQIINTATAIDSLNPGLAGQLGSGRLNAGSALTAPATPVLAIAGYSVNGQPSPRPEPGSAVDLIVTLLNRGNNAANVQATLSASDISISQSSGSFGTLPTFKSGANTAAFHLTAKAGYNTPMSFTLHVTADGGYAADLALTILTSPGIVNVPATINTQTWAANQVYLINQDSGVPVGATLTIQPGTLVRFAPNTSLSIAGTLIADGTPAQPIRFTRQGAAGSWGQLKFLDSSTDASFDGAGNYTGGTILRGTVVEYGQGITLNSAAPFIASSTFQAASIVGTPGSGATLRIADNNFLGAGISIYSANNLAILRNTITNGPAIGAGGALSVSGSGSVIGNNVSAAVGMGIDVSGAFTVASNRVVNSGTDGLLSLGGTVRNNLLANNRGHGLVINTTSPVTVSNNTIVSNQGAQVYLANGSQVLHNNNLLARAGGYALQLADNNGSAIDAKQNYWGSTDPLAIQELVYDSGKKFGLGTVDFGNPLASPDQTAPAFVQRATISPDTTLGIQAGTFELQFSRPMEQSVNPLAAFAQAKRGTWAMYMLPDFGPTSSTGMNTIRGIASDQAGVTWFATNYGLARFDGATWKAFSTMGGVPPNNSPIGGLSSIVIDQSGLKWVGGGLGLARFDGVGWQAYPFRCGSSADDPCGTVTSLALDRDGSLWFTTGPGGGIGRFNGSTWRFYRNANAGFTINESRMLTIDHNGVKWFTASNASGSGVGRFDGTTWTFYSSANSGLPESYVNGIAIDTDGSVWFSGGSALARFDGTTWTTYRNPNGVSGLSGLTIDQHGVKWAISMMDGGVVSFDGTTWKSYPPPASGVMFTDARRNIGADGNNWFGSYSPNGNAYILWGGNDFPLINNAEWLDDHTWRATYDITSLVPRGAHVISISGARDSDGMEIAPDNRFGFTVDYAGTISDRTPPTPPRIFATGIPGDASSVRITWSASDGESGIAAYRYAIGTAPGATDVVNWTTVGAGQAAQRSSATTASGAGLTRAGLGLTDGQAYWVSVQAQNSGGLWSASRYASFIAGQQSFMRVYLPLSQR